MQGLGPSTIPPPDYLVERRIFLYYPLQLRYLTIRGFTEPKVVRTGFEPVNHCIRWVNICMVFSPIASTIPPPDYIVLQIYKEYFK